MNIDGLIPDDGSVLILSARKVSGGTIFARTIASDQLWHHESKKEVGAIILSDLLLAEELIFPRAAEIAMRPSCPLPDDADSALTAPPLPWTHDKPTMPGCYWYRDARRGTTIVQCLAQEKDWKGDCFVYVEFIGSDDGDATDGMPGEWAGPLESPQ